MVGDGVEAGSSAPPGGRAVLYIDGRAGLAHHERATHLELARRIAALQGIPFHGARNRPPGEAGAFLIPSDTLIGGNLPAIRSERDMYGAVVPFPFVATKAITHPLISDDAAAPDGWSHAFAQRVRDAVLAGYTVFGMDDARTACKRLLRAGPIRLKPVHEAGGLGQTVVESEAELVPAIERIYTEGTAQGGLVIEQSLAEVTTFSIGETRIDGLAIAYCGLQTLTRNNRGAMVYGGSDLAVIRGRLADLGTGLPSPMREAVGLARAYDDAASACFPGMLATRRNYDVARGLDARGRMRQGVLEQSWRIGGASGAEVAALEAFRADDRLRVVRTRCVEVYGEPGPVPAHATLLFTGIDPKVGPITKYAVTESHGPEHPDH